MGCLKYSRRDFAVNGPIQFLGNCPHAHAQGYLQEARRVVDAAVADAIDEFLKKLDACLSGQRGFSVVVDDPAGKNPSQPLRHRS